MNDSAFNPTTMSGGELARIPGVLQRVREVVESYATDKSPSSVLGFDQQTLIDLGLILVDPERAIGDGLTWLGAEFPDEPISKSAFYRFAADFRDRYQALTAKYRRDACRLAEAAIDAVTAGGKQDDLAGVIKTQFMRLAAEGLLTADDIREFDGRTLGQMISILDSHTNVKFKLQEMQLKREDAERKATKLEADLTAKDREWELKRSRIDDQLKQLREQVDEMLARLDEGKSIDRSGLVEVRRGVTSAEMIVKRPEVTL